MKKRILAAFTAALFALLSVCSALPTLAKVEKPAVRYETPEGYNDHDYQKMVAFLETKDENGVKNGEKLNEDYDPADPETWCYNSGGGVEFQEGRVVNIAISEDDCMGSLDLSGCAALEGIWCEGNALMKIDISECVALTNIECQNNMMTELNVSGCAALAYLTCNNNALKELDVSGCAALEGLSCQNNALTELNISGCVALEGLYCYNNALTELNVSTNTSINSFDCSGNLLTELDMSNNPNFYYDSIRAEGNGTIGLIDGLYLSPAVAQPCPGAEFIGWYSEAGELISTELVHKPDVLESARVVARFSGAANVPGDCDGSGAVDTTDALYVLRCALGISGDAEEMLASCDMDGNGVIDTTDALLILRLALGIS